MWMWVCDIFCDACWILMRFCVRAWSMLESSEYNLKCINFMLAFTSLLDAFVKWPNGLFYCFYMCTFSWALARVSCNHVIKCAAWSPEQCIYTLSSAGTGIPIRVCLYHPPYGGSSLVFWCLGGSSNPRVQSLHSPISTLLWHFSLWPIG